MNTIGEGAAPGGDAENIAALVDDERALRIAAVNSVETGQGDDRMRIEKKFPNAAEGVIGADISADGSVEIALGVDGQAAGGRGAKRDAARRDGRQFRDRAGAGSQLPDRAGIVGPSVLARSKNIASVDEE